MAEQEGSSRQVCASCKLQKKRCKPGVCKMAPHFPIAKLEEFKKAHRLFGASNIHNIITSVEEGPLRQAVADSLLFEAHARREDPVRGSYDILLAQREEMLARIAELEAVQGCLEECKWVDPTLGPEERVRALMAVRTAAGGSGGGGLTMPTKSVSKKEDAELSAYFEDVEMVNQMVETIEKDKHGKQDRKSTTK